MEGNEVNEGRGETEDGLREEERRGTEQQG